MNFGATHLKTNSIKFKPLNYTDFFDYLFMKKIFTVLKYSLLAFLFILIVFCIFNYYPDYTLDEMKAKYANNESEFMEVDGMMVHYRDEGNPSDSLPLVLLHGTGSNLHTWDGWLSKMVKNHRIIRQDLPSYGLTGPNKNNDYSAQYYVQFLHNFLSKIKVKKYSLAGNSLGGKIAWEYALKFPDEIHKLILIDAAGYPYKRGGGAMVFKLAQIPVLKDILIKITPKAIIKKSMLDVYADDTKVTEALITQYHDMARRAGNRAAFVNKKIPINDNNYLNINQIKVPVLIQWGALDNWIKLENAYHFQKDLPNDTLIIYKNAGHVPMEEIPNETADDALIFLAK